MSSAGARCCTCASRTESTLWCTLQVDAKFKPQQATLELLVNFESKNPQSIPSYTSLFVMVSSPRWQCRRATLQLHAQYSVGVGVGVPQPRGTGHAAVWCVGRCGGGCMLSTASAACRTGT